MRAYIVLLALLATPLAMGVSQLPGKSSCTNGQGSVNRSAQGTAHAHKGLCVPQDPPGGTGGSGSSGGSTDGTGGSTGGTGGSTGGTGGSTGGGTGTGGTCVDSQLSTGSATVRGQVYTDSPALGWPLLAGWCVELRDAATGAVVATTLSTATGLDGENNNFLFTGVPIGNYTVCEVVPTGWHQTFPWSGPACPTGLGQSAPIAAAGSDADFNWFGNLQN